MPLHTQPSIYYTVMSIVIEAAVGAVNVNGGDRGKASQWCCEAPSVQPGVLTTALLNTPLMKQTSLSTQIGGLYVGFSVLLRKGERLLIR